MVTFKNVHDFVSLPNYRNGISSSYVCSIGSMKFKLRVLLSQVSGLLQVPSLSPSLCLYLVKAIREITDTMLAVNAAVNFVIYVVFNLSAPVASQ